MKIDRDRVNVISCLQLTATPEPWRYDEGCVKDKKDKVVAYVCDPDSEPDFQQIANGEFIAAIRNAAGELVQTVKEQQGVIERLRARVIRLEEKVYGDTLPSLSKEGS